MSKLPKGWVEVEWDQVTTKDGFRRGPFGGNLKKSCFVESGFAIYEQYAPINNDCINFRYFVDDEKYKELQSFKVDNGDFLISCSGTMGKITMVPEGAPKGLINQALLRIRLVESCIDSEYFLKLFRSPILQNQVLSSSVGGAIQNLAAVKELKKILIPLAPLAEQKRIVEKLDQVLAQVDTIKARLDGIPAILKRLRQSVLAAAVSGKLTEECRKSVSLKVPNIDEIKKYWKDQYDLSGKKFKSADLSEKEIFINLPKSWLITQIGEVCDVFVGATPSRKKLEYWNGDIPWVSSSEVAFCRISSTKESISVEGLSDTSTQVHPIGTVMLAMIGQGKTRGQVAILDIEACHNQNTAALRVPEGYVLSEFLYFFLTKQYEETRRIGAGNNQKALNKSFVQSLSFPLPSFEEQTEIVRLVDQYFAFADTIEKQVQKAQQRVDKLTQSILAKAFRGELVPQDPDDEPADELLKRIAAARTESEALAKVAKKIGKSK